MPKMRGKLVQAAGKIRSYTTRVFPSPEPQKPRTRRVWGGSTQMSKSPVTRKFAK